VTTPEPERLPDHDTEVMAAHSGQPSIETQDKTHGAGIPAVDRGVPDAEKYT
jgi:hypothetical protein